MTKKGVPDQFLRGMVYHAQVRWPAEKSMKIDNVIVWGDSLTKGIMFDEATNRYMISPHNVCDVTQQCAGIKIENRSKMGMTVTRGKSLLERDLESGMTCDAALIEFGGNDSDFNWREISQSPDTPHISRTPIVQFEESLRAMVQKLKEKGILPVLATLPPIDAQRYFDFFSRGLNKENILKWLGDVFHIYRYHEQYSVTIAAVAREAACPLIDWRAAFLRQWNNRALFCDDGIHPNEQGQALMARTALALLNNEK